MKIDLLASGSRGNCYVVSDGESRLMLECGISYKEIQQKLNFDFANIKACLITHEHKDHSKSIRDILARGMPVYTSHGTASELKVTDYNLKTVKAMEQFNIATFKVLAFDLVHDVREPLGFLIESIVTNKKLVFITDTAYCPYKFNNLTHIMIECSYSNDLINNTELELRKRIIKNHMSLETCLDFMKANDLSKVEKILVLHLSDARANEELILSELRKITGKYVEIS